MRSPGIFLILRSNDINEPYPPLGLARRGSSRGGCRLSRPGADAAIDDNILTFQIAIRLAPQSCNRIEILARSINTSIFIN